MRRPVVPVVLTLLALSFAPLAALAAPPESLVGTWSLREQYYEGGAHNFFRPEEALTVVLREAPDGLAGTLSWKEHTLDWPAYLVPRGAAPLSDVELRVEGDFAAATARYRVLPPEGDDTSLVVEERWRLEAPDRARCEVEIRFSRHGELRGGFTWTRIFVREGGR